MPAKSFALVKSLYKNEKGEPFLLTEKQEEIFDCIFKKKHPRVHIIASTRYGKSEVVALAILTRIITFPERWLVVAPSEKQASIIMQKIITHIFDNDFVRDKVDLRGEESLERLRRERSKDRITFRHSSGRVGEVAILSADSRNQQRAGDALMGHGEENVVLDESCLIENQLYSKIKRLVVGHGGGYLIEIGNPWHNLPCHFNRTLFYPEYHKIFIDYKIGLKEGRYTETEIEEARREANFDVLYECKFPASDALDASGWSPLLTPEQIKNARTKDGNPYGSASLGIDVSHGGKNKNVWCVRYENYAVIVRRDNDANLLSVAGRSSFISDELEIEEENIAVDGTGVGAGLVDALRAGDKQIQNVILGAKATNEFKFANKRAECYWRLRQWILQGGTLSDDDCWGQLAHIKWRVQANKRILIIGKEELLKRGIPSPDEADALALTFANRSVESFAEPKQMKKFREFFDHKKNRKVKSFAHSL
jgi:hypothetical protein